MNSNEFDKEEKRTVNDPGIQKGIKQDETYGINEQTAQAESAEADKISNRSVYLDNGEQTEQFDRMPAANFSSPAPDQPEGIFAEQNEAGHFQWEGLYAGFWMRFWAYLLDLIVIGSVNRMIINPVFRAMDVSLVKDGIFSPVSIATAIVFYLYFVLMTKYYGQSLGKMVFGLKVVDLSGNRLSWGTVIFREWIGRFISATIMVLYVIVAFSKKKQGLHDMFADTAVIYEQR